MRFSARPAQTDVMLPGPVFGASSGFGRKWEFPEVQRTSPGSRRVHDGQASFSRLTLIRRVSSRTSKAYSVRWRFETGRDFHQSSKRVHDGEPFGR